MKDNQHFIAIIDSNFEISNTVKLQITILIVCKYYYSEVEVTYLLNRIITCYRLISSQAFIKLIT